MDIASIDKNFRFASLPDTDIAWHSALSAPFTTHGVFYDEERGEYLRMPMEVAEKVSDGVAYLATNTAGGRIRFTTDSPFIALKCVLPAGEVMPHMPVAGSHGFGVYTDGYYNGYISPSAEAIVKAEGGTLAFEGIRYLSQDVLKGGKEGSAIEICLPLYNGVKAIFIGLKRGSKLSAPPPYRKGNPLIFYGSSITQGGCASHPGNDYVSLTARRLHTDFVNLGFSGCAKAEPAMREYLASLDASVFVVDYDHNAPTAEYLEETHYPLYAEIRRRHSKTPILFLSRPDFEFDPKACEARRKAVYETYRRAKEEGDANVAFLDGEKLWGKSGRDGCSVDVIHPNDLGFYRMAEKVYPVLKEILDGQDGNKNE